MFTCKQWEYRACMRTEQLRMKEFQEEGITWICFHNNTPAEKL